MDKNIIATVSTTGRPTALVDNAAINVILNYVMIHTQVAIPPGTF